ncbi:glycosylphosphatidylinositol anchor attachment 1 protein-like isoform X2 [Gordionus sp. m RMFG-2023]|uniref:glycosylphosphatidylinositol anchor attachment 1 protein-like isoform X2 n=1 Tax=Gordionus sp. m RMFG-2023 TaxID=3053472 RepID=UPI0031FD6C31
MKHMFFKKIFPSGKIKGNLRKTNIYKFLYNPRYKRVVCSVFYILGLLWILIICVNTPEHNGANPWNLNKHTYISENALLPGLVDETYTITHSNSHSAESIYQRLLTKLNESNLIYHKNGRDQHTKSEQNGDTTGESMRHLRDECLTKEMESILDSYGLEVYRQSFTLPPAFSHKNDTKPSHSSGINLYAIQRATGVTGYDAILLSASFDPEYPSDINFGSHKKAPKSLITSAILLSLARHFSTSANQWVAKDIIFLFTSHKTVGPQVWTRSYYTESDDNEILQSRPVYRSYSSYSTLDGEGRSGYIQAAMCLQLDYDDGDYNQSMDSKSFQKSNDNNNNKMFKFEDTIIKFEGINGRLPNLDLVNVAQRLASKNDIQTRFRRVHVDISTKVCQFTASIGLDKYIGVSFSLCKPLFNMLNTMMNLAFPELLKVKGSTPGIYPHAFFNKYGVDSVTFLIRPGKGKIHYDPSYNGYRKNFSARTLCRFLEGMVRSVNNLQEKFHQSYMFYLLTSIDNFISIANYYPAFVFLVIPLMLDCAYCWLAITLYANQGVIKLDESDMINQPTFHYDPSSILNFPAILLRITMNHCASLALYLSFPRIVATIGGMQPPETNVLAKLYGYFSIPSHLIPHGSDLLTIFQCFSAVFLAIATSKIIRFTANSLCANDITRQFHQDAPKSFKKVSNISNDENDGNKGEETIEKNDDDGRFIEINYTVTRFMGQLELVLGLFAISLINFALAYFVALFLALLSFAPHVNLLGFRFDNSNPFDYTRTNVPIRDIFDIVLRSPFLIRATQ